MGALRDFDNYEKNKQKQWSKEHKAGGFKCAHCKQWVVINDFMGTANRNHCNLCLWSRHVDERKGDRRAECFGGMRPIGLTFKHEGLGRRGEVMLIHACSACPKISINRIAADDDNEEILRVFSMSLLQSGQYFGVLGADVYMLNANDRDELHAQLFGR